MGTIQKNTKRIKQNCRKGKISHLSKSVIFIIQIMKLYQINMLSIQKFIATDEYN